MFHAKEFKNFLSNEEVFNILEFAKNTDSWNSGGHEFWDGRVLDAVSVKNENVKNTLYSIKDRAVEAIKKAYEIKTEIYPDLFQLTRWFPGMEQPPHSDDMENTEYSEQNKHREYGVVIYLNDDFVGGRTFYPQYNFEIIPEPGKMAVHPATTDHMHGVTKIEESIRYTLTTFLTFDQNKRAQ
jgi:hypothetical protein